MPTTISLSTLSKVRISKSFALRCATLAKICTLRRHARTLVIVLSSRILIHTHTQSHKHTHTHTHIHIQTHTHTHTNTCTHTHTQTYTPSALALQRLKRRRAPKVVLPPPAGNVQTKVMSATLCTFRALRACCKNETRIIRVIHQTLENCNMSLALLGFFCYLFIVMLKGRV